MCAVVLHICVHEWGYVFGGREVGEEAVRDWKTSAEEDIRRIPL